MSLPEITVDMSARRDFLRKQACFAKLTDSEIEELSRLLFEKRFMKDSVIVNEGDKVDNVYLIVSGEADVRHLKVENNQLTYDSVATLSSGNSIGLNDTGFYSLTGMRTATVVAKNDMILLGLSVAAFHGFALANSHVSEVMRQNKQDLIEDF